MGTLHSTAPLVVFSLLLMTSLQLDHATSQAAPPRDFRAIAYHVVATEQTVVNLKWRMDCPPTDYCASTAYLRDTDGSYWGHIANMNNGNVSVYFNSVAGSIAIPILEYDHEPTGDGVDVAWPVAGPGDFYFFAVSTHPGRIELEDITDADAVHVSTAQEIHFFQTSQLPGLAAARIGQPGVAAGTVIEWTAIEGTFAFSLPFPNHPAGYLRTGPTGDYLCVPLELSWCTDVFWGPPGTYRMNFGGLVDPFDRHFTGYVDMHIP